MYAAIFVASLAISSGFGVRLEEAGELPAEDAASLVAELGRALEASCGRAVTIDDPMWSSCPPGQACVEQIRARTHADDVLLVRVFGSLTLVRIVAERHTPHSSTPARTELDVPREGPERRPKLEVLARAICPEPPPPAPVSEETIAPPAQETKLWPWILIGAGAVAGGTGLIFGVSSAGARDDAMRSGLTDAQYESFADRAQAQAIAADVLFAAAAAGLISGLVMLASE